MKKITVISFLAIAVVLTAISCGDNQKPGKTFMPDMAYSRAYETYSENPLFEDNQTNRTPVEGTIAQGQLLPFRIPQDGPGDTTNFGKARFVNNPLPPLNADDRKEAERLYLIYCGICHGEKLDGNGPLWNQGDGAYPAAPKDLTDPVIGNQGDGQLFYTITYGKNKMGSYASQLDAKQRWMVVHYIKEKLGKSKAPAAEAESSVAQ
ncbi:MAG: cytochrome c [Chitinophagaceae bacterium]|nr:cytochrome c [Chitinophagaceae bacterium]MCW5929303.1 cytochrome c [Chitinophagaceae bacterium]